MSFAKRKLSSLLMDNPSPPLKELTTVFDWLFIK